METEADKIGLKLMARAGYDPSRSHTVWERMQQMQHPEKKVDSSASSKPSVSSRIKTAISELVSTHPSDQRRIHHLKEWAREARLDFEKKTDEFVGQGSLGRPSFRPLPGVQARLSQAQLDELDLLSAPLIAAASSLVVGDFKTKFEDLQKRLAQGKPKQTA
eukprot:TRINITY_DN17886_c0_g1_i4.p1 TRINITY_DN17886_c0_g1~~TRINITY_DN17886_c0_g1_i4.p1  ORF type:complete len:162 (-),score=41.30 TRINITY_DN17886_c0_g1_i4:178-663(-)